MKLKVTVLLLITGLFTGAFAQEAESSAWEKSIVGGLNLTQTGFDNWAAGGENVFSWQVNLNYKFVKDQEKYNWLNTGKLAYGTTKTGDADMVKSIDEIKMESVLTYKLGANINPYAAVTGETQFAPGFDYSTVSPTEISAFLDPGYFRESFGAGAKLSENISTRMGLSLKQTVTTDHPAPYADDVETSEIETLRSEFGAESVTDASFTITETSTYTSKLELFSSFGGLDEIDVAFDNILVVKVSEYINMNANLKIVYDKDISPKRQIKQSMALGLSYTFI